MYVIFIHFDSKTNVKELVFKHGNSKKKFPFISICFRQIGVSYMVFIIFIFNIGLRTILDQNWLQWCPTCLTRAGPGGRCLDAPSGFSLKTGGAAHLFIHLLRRFCEKFRSRSLKIMSPGHGKWPHLRKSLNARHSYTDWSIAWNFSVSDLYE